MRTSTTHSTRTTFPVLTPFASLTADQLNGAARTFAADSAVKSVNFAGPGGSNIIVHERDLAFIHSLDAKRFGTSARCALCQAEMASMEA